MSISGLGSAAGQTLAALLSQLNSTSAVTGFSDDSDDTAGASAPAATASGASNTLTGSTKASLSGDVLQTLLQLQQDTSSSATQAASTSDPLQSLFSSIDSDGDGSVSQTELENFIEQAGGSQSQADSLYAALGQTGQTSGTSGSNAGLSEGQFASALQQAAPPPGPPPAGGHHHHHHHGGGGGASQAGNDLALAIDGSGNSDGTINHSELESFVTANGGTTSQADADYAAIASAAGTAPGSNISVTQFATTVDSLLESFNTSASATKSTTSVAA